MNTIMKQIHKILLLACVATAPLAATHAQTALRSAYFLDGYTYQHQLNPALAGERNYVSMPALGNVYAFAGSTMGVNSFLYKTPNGGLTTFMNESVSASEFLNSMKKRNKTNIDVGETLLSAGFFALGGFNTVEINVRSNTALNTPRELFAFMKQGMTSEQTVYDIGDVSAISQNYAEIALGHQRQILPNLSIGAKIKFLIGMGSMYAKMNDMKVSMSGEEWKIESTGELLAAVKGLDIPTKEEAGADFDRDAGEADLLSWDDIDMGSYGLGGGGLAFDLGATYKPIESLELSLAFTDVGFLKMKNLTRATTRDPEWVFDGFHEFGMSNSSENEKLEDQVDDLGDELEDFFNFHKDPSRTSKAKALGATMTIGALYTLPFYNDRLKVGFLSTTRIHGAFSWSEGRFSANWFPCSVFDMSVNYAVSTFGHSFGWVANVHHKGINFFLGTDHQFGKITPQFLPVGRANTNVSMGINFPFGEMGGKNKKS